MNILVITSNGIRHQYFAAKVAEIFECEPKILSIAKSERHFSKLSGGVFEQHFSRYEEAELEAFGKFEPLNSTNYDRETINNPDVVNAMLDMKFDLILVFGSPILRSLWFSSTHNTIKVNFHLGLSPYYVGSGTLFWPFYNREPDYAGVTVHHLTEELDLGAPIIRFNLSNASGDYYQLVNDLLKYSIKEGLKYLKSNFSLLLESEAYNKEYKTIKSKVYRNSDLTESSILQVMSEYNKKEKLEYDIIAR